MPARQRAADRLGPGQIPEISPCHPALPTASCWPSGLNATDHIEGWSLARTVDSGAAGLRIPEDQSVLGRGGVVAVGGDRCQARAGWVEGQAVDFVRPRHRQAPSYRLSGRVVPTAGFRQFRHPRQACCHRC